MLCLFLGGSAFFEFLILGRGKPFKIKGLQVFGRWRGYNSQNFENGGRGNINQPAREVCSAKNAALEKGGSKSQKQKRKSGSTIIFIYYIYIYIYLSANANYYIRLLYILSTCAILYSRFFTYFSYVIDSKAQHMQKKSHSKKPLQFCNIKKLVKSRTYKI